MCGISGILSYGNANRYIETVNNMNASLAHRGPNGQGVWADRDVVLAHRRLAIIDLSDGGLQPMFSNDKRYALIFNGEIYNYRELKQELSSYAYQNQSDSEVILAAYARWGESCVNHFNGMFAFAIYDLVQQELFIVRDRMGIKPLYYYLSDNVLIFASELRTILTTNLVPRKLNHEALTNYVRFQTVHAPDTIIANVKMLMPGEWIKAYPSKKKALNGISYNTAPVTHGAITLQQGCYWNMDSRSTSRSPEGKTKEEIHYDIYDLLSKSVERRLMADVPFGAFLSGGIDSSVIVGLMSQVLHRPVNTFSVIFNEKEYSESYYSKLVARHFSTNHTEIHLTPDDFLRMVPEALAAMDHPSGDGPNTWVVSKMTREAGITMALSGLGGDELFAGYKLFKRLYHIENQNWIGNLPLTVRSLASKMIALAPISVPAQKLMAIFTAEDWHLYHTYPLTRCSLPDNKILGIMREKNDYPNSVQQIIQELKNDDKKHLLSNISRAELSTYLLNTLLRDTDQMSMAHALEVRVPFLDHELVEYVLQIEDSFKYPHTPKQLLVESMGSLLPKEVINRHKMGFSFPWDSWMRNELRSYCEHNIQILETYEVINNDYLHKLWKRFLQHDPLVSWSRIWPLVVLGGWMKAHDIETSM